jgi:hypothetical protein
VIQTFDIRMKERTVRIIGELSKYDDVLRRRSREGITKGITKIHPERDCREFHLTGDRFGVETENIIRSKR